MNTKNPNCFDVLGNLTNPQFANMKYVVRNPIVELDSSVSNNLSNITTNVLNNTKQIQVGEVSIVFHLGTRKISAEYIGPITVDAIDVLVRNIEDAICVYQPGEINIRMQSAGGHMRAVDFWVYKLAEWKSKGVSIKTSAGTICASAAATIVALGLIGERKTSLMSVLVFHNPRLQMPAEQVILEEDAEDMVEILKISRESMHQMLITHLVEDFGRLRFAKTLCQRAAWLQTQSIDDISILNKYVPKRKKAMIDLSTIYSWADANPQTLEDANRIIDEWTQEFKALFYKDLDIDQYIAWALMFVDQSEKLPVIIHTESDTETESYDESFDAGLEDNSITTSSFRQ